ncbi:MAG: hypothetical protein K2K96_03940 [Lachnospiraceae bacterium]|nr:hypothetical protein [Lachnospiraceae bacterium]
MDIVQVVLLGIVAVIASMLIRQKEPVIGSVLSFGIVIFTMACLISRLFVILEYLDRLMENLSFARPYLLLLLKAVGITLVTEFGASLCKENGFLALSDSIRVFGKVSILMLGIPILATLVDIINGFAL